MSFEQSAFALPEQEGRNLTNPCYVLDTELVTLLKHLNPHGNIMSRYHQFVKRGKRNFKFMVRGLLLLLLLFLTIYRLSALRNSAVQ